MSIEGTAFPVVACYQRATSASEKKKDRSSVLDLIVGISSRRENRRRPRKGRVCMCVYPPSVHGARDDDTIWSFAPRSMWQYHGYAVRARCMYASLPLCLSSGRRRRGKKKTVKDRGNDASLSTIFLSRVFGFVGFVRFLPDDTYYPSLPFCGLPRVCDT